MVRSRLGHVTPLPPSPGAADNCYDEFTGVRLEDVDVIATLGMGGFGRVELVGGTVDPGILVCQNAGVHDWSMTPRTPGV